MQMDEKLLERVCDNTLKQGLRALMDELEPVLDDQLKNAVAIIAQLTAEITYRKRTGTVIIHANCKHDKGKEVKVKKVTLTKEQGEAVEKILAKLFG